MLNLIEIEEPEKLPRVDPENYQLDMDFLEKNGFIKKEGHKVELDSRGLDLMQRITPEQKRRYRRYFFGKNKNP